MWIHEFWIQFFPQFMDNAYFIYYFLDLVGILIFFRVMFSLPAFVLNLKERKRK